MKNKFLIILMLFSVMVTFCQNETITKNFTRTKVEKIDFSKIYYKKTGKKIEKNEFIKLVKNNPNLQIENFVGIDGEIEKYLVFFEKRKKNIKNNRKNPIIKGDLFPNFIAKTIENKKIELKDNKGKIIILRFELEANTFRFKKEEIKQIDLLINKIKKKEEKIKSIIFFASNELDIKEGFDLQNSNFELIPNSLNFYQKFSITRFPNTIIIDKDGKLVDYFKYMEDINLNKLINE
jgi:peroxiredoxin